MVGLSCSVSKYYNIKLTMLMRKDAVIYVLARVRTWEQC
jgi:hypothetical protein